MLFTSITGPKGPSLSSHFQSIHFSLLINCTCFFPEQNYSMHSPLLAAIGQRRPHIISPQEYFHVLQQYSWTIFPSGTLHPRYQENKLLNPALCNHSIPWPLGLNFSQGTSDLFHLYIFPPSTEKVKPVQSQKPNAGLLLSLPQVQILLLITRWTLISALFPMTEVPA